MHKNKKKYLEIYLPLKMLQHTSFLDFHKCHHSAKFKKTINNICEIPKTNTAIWKKAAAALLMKKYDVTDD